MGEAHEGLDVHQGWVLARLSGRVVDHLEGECLELGIAGDVGVGYLVGIVGLAIAGEKVRVRRLCLSRV